MSNLKIRHIFVYKEVSEELYHLEEAVLIEVVEEDAMVVETVIDTIQHSVGNHVQEPILLTSGIT